MPDTEIMVVAICNDESRVGGLQTTGHRPNPPAACWYKVLLEYSHTRGIIRNIFGLSSQFLAQSS